MDNVGLLDLHALRHIQSEVEQPETLFRTTPQQAYKTSNACRGLTRAALKTRQNWLFLQLWRRIAFAFDIVGHETSTRRSSVDPRNAKNYEPPWCQRQVFGFVRHICLVLRFLAWARRAFKGFSIINARAETASPPTLAIAFQQLA